jgi:hypothetical protein
VEVEEEGHGSVGKVHYVCKDLEKISWMIFGPHRISTDL